MCTGHDRKVLQKVIKTAQKIKGAYLPSIEKLGERGCLQRAGNILKDSSHPMTALFTVLPSVRCFRSVFFFFSYHQAAKRLLSAVHTLFECYFIILFFNMMYVFL